MLRQWGVAAAMVFLAGAALFPQPWPDRRENVRRELTLRDRVRAQEGIERVYYGHQLGSVVPFERAVPRALLDKKVRTYLKQSAALEAFWSTPVTAEMLEHELARMTRGSRMSDRLREIFAALGDDPFVVAECLARATLVDRLTRNFFAFDPTIHADAKARAEDLRFRLVSGEIDPSADHPGRYVADVPKEKGPHRDEAPARVPELAEEPDAFLVRVTLGESLASTRVATYVVPKLAWDDWWEGAERGLSAENVAPVAASAFALPPRVLPQAICDAGDRWDDGVLDDLPAARSGHTAIWTGSELVIWGGSGASLQNTGARYDPLTDTWSRTSTVGAPSARTGHTAVWTGTEMIVWGGGVNTGGRYDPAANAWTPTSTLNAPSPRSGHAAVWTGTEMIVWGGPDNTGSRYNPVTDSWRPISTLGAPSAGICAAVWTGEFMVVAGLPAHGGRYNPSTDTWSPMSTANAPQTIVRTPVWTGSEMISWSCGEGGRYNPATDTWTHVSSVGAPGEIGCASSAVWTGARMVVWGGNDGKHPLNTGARYDPATDTWQATAGAGAPPGRYGHTATWTGQRMLVWGGQFGANSGGRYDPVSNTWTPTSTVGPAASSFASAVWTGTQMIVWGGAALWSGSDSTPSVNTGGRYDPATDSWSATATAGAPSGRLQHSAVWTGSRMIVWGGKDRIGGPAGSTSTGGSYDPIANSWSPISKVSAPSARAGHSALWTGSRMLIWGGYDGWALGLNSGARYDPLGDAWTPMSTTAAPSPRYPHTAVWTGTRMVVWGGTDNTATVLDTGGRYDPSTDGWEPTSSTGAPTARTDHAAVWTGHEMLVWGGHDSGGQLATGGRYDPVNDSWTAMSLTSVPPGRSSPATIWTGRRMVVWGGRDDGGALASGGRYDPALDGWTPATTADAPGPSASPVAVWSGNRMIVWAGNSAGGRYSPGSTDLDVDGVCDEIDDCPDSYDPSQTDSNQDGEGDACDVDDGLIYVTAPDRDHHAWQAEEGFTTWNDYRGSIAVLRATGAYTQAPGSNALAARDCGLASPNVFDSVVPGVGEVEFTLVTGVSGGVESGLGTNHLGVNRPNTNPCP